MGTLDGRVAIITGAGRGLGREHALLFAGEGAKVVVNDLGGDIHGEGADRAPAQQVVDEILAIGGEAVANTDNVADFEGAKRLVDLAVETFGDLHALVNNAGILRDRVLVNMTEQEWDAVIHVHLKGHFCPTRHAAAYWREQVKAGKEVKASIVHTSSTSGLFGNPGQTNYGAAKSGIATFSQICAMELSRYGVRSNAIAPVAAHAPHRVDARPRGRRQGARGRVGVRRVGPGQRVADGGVPLDGRLPVHGRDVPVPGRDGHPFRVVGARREDRQRRRPVHRHPARRAGTEARAAAAQAPVRH